MASVNLFANLNKMKSVFEEFIFSMLDVHPYIDLVYYIFNTSYNVNLLSHTRWVEIIFDSMHISKAMEIHICWDYVLTYAGISKVQDWSCTWAVHRQPGSFPSEYSWSIISFHSLGLRYMLNQFRALHSRPNYLWSTSKRISWSMLSNATLRDIPVNVFVTDHMMSFVILTNVIAKLWCFPYEDWYSDIGSYL